MNQNKIKMLNSLRNRILPDEILINCFRPLSIQAFAAFHFQQSVHRCKCDTPAMASVCWPVDDYSGNRDGAPRKSKMTLTGYPHRARTCTYRYVWVVGNYIKVPGVNNKLNSINSFLIELTSNEKACENGLSFPEANNRDCQYITEFQWSSRKVKDSQ